MAGTTGDCCSTASSSLAGKGHSAVYTADGALFEVPLVYLGMMVFGELLAMSQEEFGFAGDNGRITLTCDASVMEGAAEEVIVGVDAAVLEREAGGAGLGGDGVLLAVEGRRMMMSQCWKTAVMSPKMS
ncbi:hypothetical protein OsI_11103 [Oryza sativa Indica Group]|uniref:Uncharacterized protein n=1 Tax=Oryza sativa subsp. indica TaxID=39946 RepID=A2XFG3_ORYSI|nr:hypothetical protein OsI_11103 [Oryza sativa Indica Group]